MSTPNINSNLILEAANRFFKMAQGFGMQITTDPMLKALNTAIGAKVKKIADDAINTSITDIQINIVFDPDNKTAKFVIYSDGSENDKNMVTNALNQLAGTAYSVISKYQRTPMDFKYATYRK